MPNTRVAHIEIPRLKPFTLVGFVQNIGTPASLIIVRSPIEDSTMPAVTLEASGQAWQAEPAHLSWKLLRPWPAVVIPDQRWLHVLLEMAARYLQDGTNSGYIDRTRWNIALRWDYWEMNRLSWEDRADDLSGLVPFHGLGDNALHQACRRLKLIRGKRVSDKNALTLSGLETEKRIT